MTIILVQVNNSTLNDGANKWAIIELQGDLKPFTVDELRRKCVGNLHYNKYGQPILLIGHHILQGREEKLPKPFALLSKITVNELELNSLSQSQNVSLSGTILDQTVNVENKTKSKTKYFVQGICTKKLIFKGRPKPVIMNVVKKK